MTDAQSLIRSVEVSRASVLESTARLSDAQAAFRPTEGEWTIVDVLEHLYLAEVSRVTKIWAAVEGVRAGRPWTGAKPNAGEPIADIVAVTWKPREAARSMHASGWSSSDSPWNGTRSRSPASVPLLAAHARKHGRMKDEAARQGDEADKASRDYDARPHTG